MDVRRLEAALVDVVEGEGLRGVGAVLVHLHRGGGRRPPGAAPPSGPPPLGLLALLLLLLLLLPSPGRLALSLGPRQE